MLIFTSCCIYFGHFVFIAHITLNIHYKQGPKGSEN